MCVRSCIALGMLFVCALSHPAVQAGEAKTSAQPRTDRFGDPLPEGARLRLGTLRFRTGYGARLLLAFSRDGRALISADPEGHIIHWDPLSGRQLRDVPNARGGMALSGDGRVLACVDHDAISMRDTAKGNELRRIAARPERGMALSNDGARLASWISERNTQGRDRFFMVVWDVSNGSELARIPAEADDRLRWFTLSADGKLVVTESAKDKAICVWDVASGVSRVRVRPEAGHWFSELALDPQCATLAVIDGSEGSTAIALWDLAAPRLMRRMPVPWRISVETPAPKFSPSGLLVGGAGDKTAVVWNAKTGEAIRKFKVVEPGIPIQVAFSPDDRLFACSAADGLLKVWDIRTGKPTSEYPGPATSVDQMAFAPDGNTLASRYTLQRAVSVWNCDTGQSCTIAPGLDWLGGISFSRDGKEILAGSRDHCLIAWDAKHGNEIRRYPYPKSRLSRNELAISPERIDMIGSSPNGRTIYARSVGGLSADDLRVHAWDAASGKTLFHREVDPGPLGGWLQAASPGMELLATGDGCLQEWSTGRTLVKLACPHPTRCSDLTFSGSGDLLAGIVYLGVDQQDASGVMYRGGIEVRVWEVATGSIVLSFPLPESHFTHPVLSPDGRVLAVSNRDWIRFFNVPTGQVLLERKGFPTEASKLLFSPDGSTLASGFLDSTILLWDVAGVTAPRNRRLTPAQLEASWTELAGEIPTKAYAAARNLQDAGKGAVAFIGARLHPVAEVPAEKIRKLIGDLDGKTFAARERAMNELLRLTDFAESALREALKNDPSPESAMRISGLLEEPGKLWPGDRLRAIRCIHVLEAIGSPGAKAVLTTLATGASAARETREAKAALERLAHRPKSPR